MATATRRASLRIASTRSEKWRYWTLRAAIWLREPIGAQKHFHLAVIKPGNEEPVRIMETEARELAEAATQRLREKLDELRNAGAPVDDIADEITVEDLRSIERLQIVEDEDEPRAVAPA